jgi:hypothetical protein
MAMNDYYVYLIHDRMGDPVYVGKGRGRRAAWNGKRNAKIKALISFGGTLPPVKVREGLTESEAYAIEKALVAFHGREDLGTGTLMNLCDGGAGTPNMSAEHRAAIAEANRKRGGEKRGPQPAEHRAAISGGLRGKPWSAARRAAQQAMREQ